MTDEKITISVRDIPESLWWQVKQAAAREQLSLRNFLIKVLSEAVAPVSGEGGRS